MANVPGSSNILPSVVVDVESIGTGVSVPAGVRVAAIIGEGARRQTLISSAQGGGLDGLNPTYTSATGADGRHFLLSNAPVQSNRTKLFKNGVPLDGLEAQIDSNTFPNAYGYRIDIATGQIELQRAHLLDQGGSFYKVGATNVGTGTIQNLTLSDTNAPTETWTIKCVSVQRNGSNVPIANTARFVAFGSVSGNLLDVNGNTIVWVANNTVATNTVLSFSILETSTVLREGDYFTVKVESGTLNRNDSLVATYIGVADLNDPTFFDAFPDITAKHGLVSLENTLSLGAQLAFANSTPGVMCVQAAPSIARRQPFVLSDAFPGTSTDIDNFVIPLPLGVSPDVDSTIHVFVTNPATGVEKQLLPNKFPFFTLGDSGQPTVNDFVFDDTNPPSGNSFSYSVIQQNASLNYASDGYLNRNLSNQVNAVFGSDSVVFDSSYIGKQLFIVDSVNGANEGTFDVVAVSNGKLEVLASGTPPFVDYVNETSLTFELIDPIFGTVVASSNGTDGALVATANTATGAFTSAAIDFGSFNVMTNGYKLRITAATNLENVGLFDITNYSGVGDTLTIAKSFVSESNLTFEVIDSTQTSDYLVLNHNVVPNGYKLRVTLVDVKDAAFFDAGWEAALASLETQECDIVVPLPTQTISAIFQTSLIHCQTMSNNRNRKERVLFCGAINGLVPANLTGAKAAAVENIGVLEGIQGATISDVLAGNTEDLTNYSVPDSFGGTFRAVYFFPDQIVVQVGSDNQIISGYFAAAAAAGFLAGSSAIQQPLTNKILAGFSILKNRQFSQTVYEALAAAGVCILAPVQGGGRVLWGKTTTISGVPEEEEISIVFIRDRIAKTLRTGFQGYIGNAEDANTLATLFARATSLCNSFISQNLITDYQPPVVTKDLVDPRQYNIVCKVVPVYSINWIYIRVGVGSQL